MEVWLLFIRALGAKICHDWGCTQGEMPTPSSAKTPKLKTPAAPQQAFQRSAAPSARVETDISSDYNTPFFNFRVQPSPKLKSREHKEEDAAEKSVVEEERLKKFSNLVSLVSDTVAVLLLQRVSFLFFVFPMEQFQANS